MEMDNGRKLVQFVIKQGKTLPPGFAGSEYKYTGVNYSLVVDRVHPPRSLAGGSAEQSRADAANVKPVEGFCFFSNSDLANLPTSHVSLSLKINVPRLFIEYLSMSPTSP